MAALIRGVLITILSLLVSCTSQSNKLDYHVKIAGGPSGWPVWIESLAVDGRFLPGGVNGRGFDDVPPVGASTIMGGSTPAPNIIESSWFSYREQRYYQAKVKLPDDTGSKLRDWHKRYPTPDYVHYLLLGFSGKGEVLVWWLAHCSACGFDRSQDFSAPLIENVKAQEVPGDPDKYRTQTQQFINEGRIPASVLQ